MSNLNRYLGETVRLAIGAQSTVSGTLQLVNDEWHVGALRLDAGKQWRVVKERGEYWLKEVQKSG